MTAFFDGPRIPPNLIFLDYQAVTMSQLVAGPAFLKAREFFTVHSACVFSSGRTDVRTHSGIHLFIEVIARGTHYTIIRAARAGGAGAEETEGDGDDECDSVVLCVYVCMCVFARASVCVCV